jgi:hypothetical protein
MALERCEEDEALLFVKGIASAREQNASCSRSCPRSSSPTDAALAPYCAGVGRRVDNLQQNIQKETRSALRGRI